MILRTAEWEGLDPAPGDVVRLPGGAVAIVEHVAQGAGPGQWRLDCRPARLIQWEPLPDVDP